jgi:hypothetical protein
MNSLNLKTPLRLTGLVANKFRLSIDDDRIANKITLIIGAPWRLDGSVAEIQTRQMWIGGPSVGLNSIDEPNGG